MNRAGFALLSALWLLIALAALSLELSVVARHRRLIVANTLESVRAERAAKSGIEEERARLAQLAVGGSNIAWRDQASIVDPWRSADSVPHDTASVGDGTKVVVASRDLGTLVNLNLVDEPGLTRFLAAVSIDANTADALSQAIMDWRDADDFRRLRGAEREDYSKAGARELPRNGPFEDIDELRFIRGMTPTILSKIAPSLTVFGNGEVNVNKASDAVLLSVPGMTPLGAAVITGVRRGRRRIQSLRELMDMLPLPARAALTVNPVGAARLTFETHDLEIRAVGWVDGSPVRAIETAVVTRVGAIPLVTWRRAE
ncbi:MAG TPA: hypothetical protein VI259_01275 [Gemmatimonadaceae bacterium]